MCRRVRFGLSEPVGFGGRNERAFSTRCGLLTIRALDRLPCHSASIVHWDSQFLPRRSDTPFLETRRNMDYQVVDETSHGGQDAARCWIDNVHDVVCGCPILQNMLYQPCPNGDGYHGFGHE